MTTLATPPTALSAEPRTSVPADAGGRLEPSRFALYDRLPRVGRALLVGAVASLIDLAILSAGIRWVELGPTLARFIALVSSGLLTFFGSRSFAFRAQAGNISRQARLFVLSELLGLALNLAVFRLLVSQIVFVAPELLSQLANFVVFLGFYYPARALVVFRVASPLDDAPDRSA